MQWTVNSASQPENRGLDCAINRRQWALAAWTRWLESSTGSIFMEEFPCPCYESPSQSKIWFWGRRGDYKILQQYCNIWYQVDSDSVNWFQSCRVRDVSAFLCRSYLGFGTRASTSHCDPLCTSPRSGLACSWSLWALDEARSTSSCTAWLVIQDGSLVRCACAVILCSWRYVKCVFFIFQKLTIPTQVSLYCDIDRYDSWISQQCVNELPCGSFFAEVRSFEYLRCLGGGLIDEEMQGALAWSGTKCRHHLIWSSPEVVFINQLEKYGKSYEYMWYEQVLGIFALLCFWISLYCPSQTLDFCKVLSRSCSSMGKSFPAGKQVRSQKKFSLRTARASPRLQ